MKVFINDQYNVICVRRFLIKRYYIVIDGKICQISRKEFYEIKDSTMLVKVGVNNG